MANFNDFDLDLKKVKSANGSARGTSGLVTPSIEYITKTIANKCMGTADTPTTGHSAVCCNKKADVEPKCI